MCIRDRIIGDAALAIWGPEDLFSARAPGLSGAVEILGRRFPQYDLLLIVAGPVVLGLLWLLLMRTRWGRLLRAAAENRDMLAALGVNQAWLFTSAFTPVSYTHLDVYKRQQAQRVAAFGQQRFLAHAALRGLQPLLRLSLIHI